jgi:hypothetical protein
MTDIHADPAGPGTKPTARVEVVVSKGLPETGEPRDIIGYWPEHVRTEASKRGYYPMIRIMWPEDFEFLTSRHAAQVARDVVLDRPSETAEWMTPTEFGHRHGVARSTVYEWMAKNGFPRRRGCRGGKSIPVKEADEFLKLGGLLRGKKRGFR